jgi:hypothetical protein
VRELSPYKGVFDNGDFEILGKVSEISLFVKKLLGNGGFRRWV